jgi:hypothetical protein
MNSVRETEVNREGSDRSTAALATSTALRPGAQSPSAAVRIPAGRDSGRDLTGRFCADDDLAQILRAPTFLAGLLGGETLLLTHHVCSSFRIALITG